MPQNRAKPPNAGRGSHQSRRGRRGRQDGSFIDVFHELLVDAESSPFASVASEGSKPLKRRRLNRQELSPAASNQKPSRGLRQITSPGRGTSPVKADAERRPDVEQIKSPPKERHPYTPSLEGSEVSAESDFEWEEVNLGQKRSSSPDEESTQSSLQDLHIIIGADEGIKEDSTPAHRKGITALEKKKRLDIHKVHVLCLLYHSYVRNKWCNDQEVQNNLKRLLTPKMITFLHPDPMLSQFQAAESFMKGLLHINAFWKDRYALESYGMQKPRWIAAEDDITKFKLVDHADPPLTLDGLRVVSTTLKGSQDVGAQLLCALFRSIGVEARLVCSLQCLQFTAVAPVRASNPRAQTETIHLDSAGNRISHNSPQDHHPGLSRDHSNVSVSHLRRITQIGRSRRGVPFGFDKGKAPKLKSPIAKPKIRPAYPVFWVEVFNAAHQKWVAVDPLATFTINKPGKLEPPINSEENTLVYAMAYEDDGTIKDVTRRYCKAFNAKTRKLRVENTDGGARWWAKALKPFRRHRTLDRDQLEDATLARNDSAEGLPRNVQDFKSHPLYVLERHLKQNEVIHPRNAVGKVNVGSSISGNLESVYRRRDVHIVRSGDRWYRLGREVKIGEQPLKYTTRRRHPKSAMDDANGSDNESDAQVGLYAAYQTELYVPPPVLQGRIPKNAFGNLDVYVPSMIPAGGSHIRSKEASKAARIIGVDYANAVTGFRFKGRQGTAIVDGCIVAKEYAEALYAVIDGLAYLQEQTENNQRRVNVLRLWKRFLVGLKIVERVNAYANEDELQELQKYIDEAERQGERTEDDEGGGFFPDDGDVAMPSAMEATPFINETQEFGGGYLKEDSDVSEAEFEAEKVGLPPKTETLQANSIISSHGEPVEVKTVQEHSLSTSSLTFGSSLLSQSYRYLISVPMNNIPHSSRIIYKGPELDQSSSSEDVQDESSQISPKVPRQPLSHLFLNTTHRETKKPSPDAPNNTPGTDEGTGCGPTDNNVETSRFRNRKQKLEARDDRNDSSNLILLDTVKANAENHIEGSDDQASLPSHDPDDEDAEPEWLLSDDDKI